MNSRKRSRTQDEDDIIEIEPPLKRQKADLNNNPIINHSNLNQQSQDDHDEDDEGEDESDDESDSDNENDAENSDESQSEDEKDNWDEIDWFFYYQMLYDQNNDIDPLLYDWDEYIYKLARNRRVIPVDGCDDAHLKWDIYICNKLMIDNTKINNLKNELINLGKINNDWRDNEPILNIIDPDLYVYKYYDKLQQKKGLKFVKDTYDYMGYKKDNDNIDFNKGYLQRTGYQWIGTEFTENKSNTCNHNKNKIQITSNIHNISPRGKYENIYNGLEYLFESMLPLFNQFDAFKNRPNDSFQVIVKSQRYCINDMSGYKGHWHKEGLTEDIIIAGLYYFEKDINLKGGRLKFRNHDTLNTGDTLCYMDMDWKQYKNDKHPSNDNWDNRYHFGFKFKAWLETEQSVEINEGTAVVFSNIDLVHRVSMLKNKMNDNEKRYRSFIAFFIIDPNKKTDISTLKYPTLKRNDYANIICEIFKCSMVIAMVICEYGGCGMTLLEAKNLRKKDIEIRKNTKTKGKWAISWGNEGISKTWVTFGESGGWANQWESTTNSEL